MRIARDNGSGIYTVYDGERLVGTARRVRAVHTHCHICEHRLRRELDGRRWMYETADGERGYASSLTRALEALGDVIT